MITVIAVLLVVLILLLLKPQEKRGEALLAYALAGVLGAGIWYAGPFALGLGISLFTWIWHKFSSVILIFLAVVGVCILYGIVQASLVNYGKVRE